MNILSLQNSLLQELKRRLFKIKYEKNTGLSIIEDNLKPEKIKNKTYRTKKTLRYKKAITLRKTPLPRQMRNYHKKVIVSQPSYLTIFKNAYLLGKYAIGLTEDKEILLETTIGNYLTLHHYPENQIKKDINKKTEREIDYAISLVNIFNNRDYKNYYHWTIESLLLLNALDFLPRETRKNIKIIINKEPEKYQIDSLHTLGIIQENIILWEYHNVFVKNLIVPSPPRTKHYLSNIIQLGSLDWLRYNILRKTPDLSTLPMVYISRKNSNFRRIINEEELMMHLKPLGFVRIYLEKINFSEQVAIFKNAKFIISPHGAGLVNIIYSNNDTKVIEIIGETDKSTPYTHFFTIASLKKMYYGIIEAEKTLSIEGQTIGQRYDMFVDVRKITSLIEELNHRQSYYLNKE